MEIITDLSFIGPVELSSQEGGNLLGFDTVDRRTSNGFIKRIQIALEFENYIRGELDLHQAPMIPRWEMSKDGAEHFRGLIQSPVKEFHLQSIGEVLGFLEVLRLDQGIVQKTVREAFSLEKISQVIVAIKIELQPEGSPGGHPQITQTQILKNEVKIVMDAFGLGAPKKRLTRLFIMPGFERGTGLHGGEDMDQSRMISALGDDPLDPFFLTEILFPDKLDLQSILLGQLLGPQTDFVPQGFDKLGIIENPNALGSQIATHGVGIANIGKRSGDHDPVKTRENSTDFAGISFYQHGHGSNLLRDTQKDSLRL
jgi:hypothetical protein